MREGNKPREEDYSFYLKTWVHEPKLHLIEEDDKVYQQLLKGEIERLSDSNHNLVNNYKYFCQLLEANAEDFTFDDLIDTLDKLEIIHILLGTHDDAQLIFESLNSTGLALTEADKIRNYMLMALPAEEQTTYYREYWTQIEEYTKAAPTLFFRDYLTIKKELGKPVKISDIYYEWKKYMAERDRKKEIVQIHTYAEYYHKVTTGKGIKKTTISKQIAEISTLKITVVNSFFIQFLKYADDQELTPAQITEVLDVMENVFVRRIICEYNTNALSQITCSLHRNILERLKESTKKTPAAPTTYTEILKAYLLKYTPKDEEFTEKIKTRHLYNILKPHLYFILDRLENKFETETNTVISDLKNKKISIEHILPQKLNEHWRSELGENWEEIHKKYLHTLANLTLTGGNSQMSNRPFSVKRNDDALTDRNDRRWGFRNSTYHLTQEIAQYDQWTETEILDRAKKLTDKLLQIYPFPTTNFSLKNTTAEYSLADAFSPTGRKLKEFYLCGQLFKENHWNGMLVAVALTLANKNPKIFKSIATRSERIVCISEQPLDTTFWRKLTNSPNENRWVFINLSNEAKLLNLRKLLTEFGVDHTDLIFILTEDE